MFVQGQTQSPLLSTPSCNAHLIASYSRCRHARNRLSCVRASQKVGIRFSPTFIRFLALNLICEADMKKRHKALEQAGAVVIECNISNKQHTGAHLDLRHAFGKPQPFGDVEGLPRTIHSFLLCALGLNRSLEGQRHQ